MDGNGRWAKARGQARMQGHRAGVESVRRIVKACAEKNIDVLTLFAFGQENWHRPRQEVSYLHSLLFAALSRELGKLVDNNIRLKIIGDDTGFAPSLRDRLKDAELKTQKNTGMQLVIAFNYSGQWDLQQAFQSLFAKIQTQQLSSNAINRYLIEQHLSTTGLPAPDLFIRTSGEYRLSNFLLWQLAYTELYFTDVLWPDFNETHLEQALLSYQQRQRRFGYTGDQTERDKSMKTTTADLVIEDIVDYPEAEEN